MLPNANDHATKLTLFDKRYPCLPLATNFDGGKKGQTIFASLLFIEAGFSSANPN